MTLENIKNTVEIIKSQMMLAQKKGTNGEQPHNGASSSEEDILLARIVEATKSSRSLHFYRKAIAKLGSGIVEEELGELIYGMKQGRVRSPAKYFTRLLNKRFDPSEQKSQGLMENDISKGLKLLTHFSSTQLSLFRELESRPIQPGEVVEERSLAKHYSKDTLPWVTFVGPQFFTLSTNKAKSDTVMAEFHAMDGSKSAIPMLRGQWRPGAKEYGILTAEHGRVLGALVDIWMEQGMRYMQCLDGTLSCYCYVQVRQLSKILGWNQRKLGAAALNHLVNMVTDLSAMPYYLDLSSVQELKEAGKKGIGFKFLSDTVLLDKKAKKRPQTVMKIAFSEPYSRQLVLQRAVSRSKEMLKYSREITFLVRLYLEPRLLNPKGKSAREIELRRLINDLNLPKAEWHKTPWRRKQIFQRVVHDLNGAIAADGRRFLLKIQKGLQDYMLSARLIPSDRESKEIQFR